MIIKNRGENMARDYSQLKRGSLELVVLLLLKNEDMYGYDLCKQINARSHDLFPVQMASLYPVLYRLIKDGSISAREMNVGKRKRIYYHLEESGIQAFEEMRSEYDSLTEGIRHIFLSAEPELEDGALESDAMTDNEASDQ